MPTPTYNLRTRRRAQQGQTIVIALLVLLLLGFIGGLFASIVTGNLRNAARANRVQTADYYAEAGIRFADDQLTHNPSGADWRPPLQFQLGANYLPKDTLGSARYGQAVTALPAPDPNDPDLPFLQQGFARYNIGTGRFLLRLTYDPVGVDTGVGGDPNARYIKIESVGREGSVDPTDPTTFVNKPAIRLASTLVEYKAIGLTDYARFETNPDKRSDIMALGVASQQYVTDFDANPANGYKLSPPLPGLLSYDLVTTYGAPDAYTVTGNSLLPTVNPTAGSNLATANTQPGGGGIHANGPVRFYGLNYIYLNHTGGITETYNEGLEVAGDLLLDNYGTAGPNYGVVKVVQSFPLPPPPSPAPQPPAPGLPYMPTDILPTNASQVAGAQFDTLGGAVRDGSSGTDTSGNPRSANRLEPPVLESTNPATNLPRYQDLAIHSLPRVADSYSPAIVDTTPTPTAALHGYGQAIYVDNSSDIQNDSTSLVGGYTLVDEWLHRAPPGLGRNSWSASYYRPPGVEIVLGQQTVTNNTGTNTFYGVRLTRSDVDESGKPVLWKDPNPANASNDLGATMVASYTSMNASHALDPTGLSATDLAAYKANPNNDVVIYAEGNVRVRGTVSAPNGATVTSENGGVYDKLPRHVTIVTNGTAYIEGSLLRGNLNSSISVLAHDYVCINTTQFLAGAQTDDNPLGTRPPGPFSGDPDLNALDFSASDEALLEEFQYIAPTTINNNTSAPALYISGGPSAPGDTSADFDFVNASTGYSVITPNTILFQGPFPLTFTSVGTNANGMTHITVPLTIAPFAVTLPQSDPVLLAVRRTPSPLDTGTGFPVTTSTQDFLLERAAVLPADVHIEAVLFAETRSFFVIPGDWFNTNTSDNLAAFVSPTQGNTVTRPGIVTAIDNEKRFPFFGQPIDMKIIITGSVSEARPADIAAQTAWMEKWGWIPLYHGSVLDPATGKPEAANRNSPINTSATPSAPGIGLTLLYNPQGGYPYAPAAAGGGGSYLRTDIYGRPLPYTPNLPVCTGLLYSGQNATDQPILQ